MPYQKYPRYFLGKGKKGIFFGLALVVALLPLGSVHALSLEDLCSGRLSSVLSCANDEGQALFDPCNRPHAELLGCLDPQVDSGDSSDMPSSGTSASVTVNQHIVCHDTNPTHSSCVYPDNPNSGNDNNGHGGDTGNGSDNEEARNHYREITSRPSVIDRTHSR